MLRRTFMWAMVVSLSACALAGIVVLLFPRIAYEGEVLGSAATVGLYSLLAMVCAIVLERARARFHRPLAVAGIALALLAMLLVLAAIWDTPNLPDEEAMKTVLSATLLAANIAHLGLYGPTRLFGAARWAKIGAISGTTLFCLLTIAFVWLEPPEDFFARLLGILAILAVTGSLLTPILWKMQASHRRQHATPTLRPGILVHVRCPRCALDQDLPLTKAKCARCKLEIRIDVEEPRCTCGYELLGLTSETCPECGRPIPEDDRWALASETTRQRQTQN